MLYIETHKHLYRIKDIKNSLASAESRSNDPVIGKDDFHFKRIFAHDGSWWTRPARKLFIPAFTWVQFWINDIMNSHVTSGWFISYLGGSLVVLMLCRNTEFYDKNAMYTLQNKMKHKVNSCRVSDIRIHCEAIMWPIVFFNFRLKTFKLLFYKCWIQKYKYNQFIKKISCLSGNTLVALHILVPRQGYKLKQMLLLFDSTNCWPLCWTV